MPFQKGNPGRRIGSKNKTTLLMEERRAIFDAKISQKWEKVIDKLPPTYVADQFIGKPKETTDHKVEFLFENAKDSVEKLVETMVKLPTETGGSGTSDR